MKKITFEQAEIDSQKCDYAIEAAGTKENPINWGDAAGFYLSGYNTCVDEAEKEIQEITELANRSYQEGLRDGRLPIPGLEKEIAELKSALDTWINKYDQLVIQHNRDNSSQPESDWHTKHLTAHIDFERRIKTLEDNLHGKKGAFELIKEIAEGCKDIEYRLRKLEAGAIMDGDKIELFDGHTSNVWIITKIK